MSIRPARKVTPISTELVATRTFAFRGSASRPAQKSFGMPPVELSSAELIKTFVFGYANPVEESGKTLFRGQKIAERVEDQDNLTATGETGSDLCFVGFSQRCQVIASWKETVTSP